MRCSAARWADHRAGADHHQPHRVVDVFGYAEAIFPTKYPALFSMVAAFVGIWFFSVTDKSKRAGGA